MKNIGIFGGSFDPIHLGHLGLAEDALKLAGLERVIFMPAARQPFKLDRETASGGDRLEMIRLAIEDLPHLAVSTYELDCRGISYTYLTMREMKKHAGCRGRLYFITGSDTFVKIESWKNSKELLTEYSYIVGSRPGCVRSELETCIRRIKKAYNTEVKVIDNVELDISSTDIRKRMETGVSACDLIPDRVEAYIRERGLYGSIKDEKQRLHKT